MVEKQDLPERPRVEPEIIPPDHSRTRTTWRPNDPFGGKGAQRIYVTRLGPFGGVLLLLAIVVLAAVILFAVIGAFLIWIPIAVLIVIGAAVAGLLRPRRR